jgi:insulysin
MNKIHAESPPTAAYEEIPDLSNMPLLNPDLKERQTAKIRLRNGLEIFLISDPGADQSSAAVAVDAGSWNDPEAYPGMAHFCEHMLFLGCKKYPGATDFMKQVSDLGGLTNAFTAADRTVYMFSCKHSGFLETLDHFSRFFIDPSFDPSNISRELHAVDQEFAKNLENDRWREYMVFKELNNPNHPNRKFGSGNSDTLSGIPSEALLAWHQKHYGANRMHLFLYSNKPIETLKEEATLLFSEVPPLTTPPDLTTANGQVTSPKQRGAITYIKPIQEKQTLSLTWELPPHLSNDPSHSAELVAYALERGQPNSLYEKLKAEQLIDHLVVDVDDIGGKNHQFMFVVLELTPKGIAQMQTAVLHCFEALKTLQTSGVPRYLFEERNAVAKLTYQYQAREDAFQMAESIGRTLSDEPLASFPRAQIVATSYSPEKIGQVLQILAPETCCISLSASPGLSGVEPDQTEQWFKAEYKLSPVPDRWMALWKHSGLNPDIRVAGPNPFLPTNFALTPTETGAEIPSLLGKTGKGIAYYARCPEFSAPEAVIHLHLRSPEILASAKSAVLTSLYLDHFTDVVQPTLSAAKLAGLTTRMDLEKLKIHLQITGFNEKAPLLLKTLLTKMAELPLATKEQFDIYVARHEKMFANGSRNLPLYQARDLLDSVLTNDRASNKERLAAIQNITYEEFLQFSQKLLEKTYVEALFAGNLSPTVAHNGWLDVQQILGKEIYPKGEHNQPEVLSLPAQKGPFALSRETEAGGNAAILVIDQGPFSLEHKSAQEILGVAMRESFFNELRTKQKTGYIVRAEPLELEEKLFHTFMVQSNSHQPEDLVYRFELFFEEYLQTLSEELDQARFSNLKATCIHSLRTRFRNLKDKAGLWNILAFEKGADFRYIEKRIAALEALTYEQAAAFIHKSLARQNLRRLAIFFEGRLNTPFAYETIDTLKLREISRYEPKRVVTK